MEVSAATEVARKFFSERITPSAALLSAAWPPTFHAAPSLISVYGEFTPLTSTRLTSAESSRCATRLSRSSNAERSKFDFAYASTIRTVASPAFFT